MTTTESVTILPIKFIFKKKEKKLKKLSLALLSVAFIALASCSHGNGLGLDYGSKKEKNTTKATNSTVETISVKSVIPSNADKNAKPVTQEKFNSVALPKLQSEFMSMLSGMTPSNMILNNGSRSVKAETLKEAFNNIQNSFDITETDTSGTINGKWEGPTGQIDFEDAAVKGLAASINELALEIDADYKVQDNSTAVIKASGYAGFGASIDFDVSNYEAQSVIKTLKLNAALKASLDNLKAEVGVIKVDDPEMEGRNAFKGLKSVSGKYSFYTGLDGASYFEFTDESGEKYNGVIKIEVKGNVNLNLSKQNTEKFIEQLDSIGGNNTAAFISLIFGNEDFFKTSVELSVYNTSGSKICTFLKSDSLSEASNLLKTDTSSNM